MWVFSWLSILFASSMCLSVLISILYSSDYCSFVLQFEIRKCDAARFVVFSQVDLAIQGILWLYTHFRIACSISVNWFLLQQRFETSPLDSRSSQRSISGCLSKWMFLWSTKVGISCICHLADVRLPKSPLHTCKESAFNLGLGDTWLCGYPGL